MDRLIEEASSIRRILPWIQSEQDIINYLRKIPLDKTYLRIHLTILHFLKERDLESDAEYKQDIEDDAIEIVSLLPDTAYKVIKDQLTVMGNMPNRREAVVRQLLLTKPELGVLVSELDANNVCKEKPNSICQSVDNKDVHNQTNTNINIKIRNVDGTLQVVSSIKQEKVLTHSKVGTCSSLSESTTSDDLPHSSTHNSSTSYPSLRQNLNEVTERCSESIKPSSVNSNIRDNNVEPITFDLVGYLKEVTQVAEEKIISVCLEERVPLNQRPHVVILNDLLNKVLNNEVIDLDSSLDTDEEMSTYENKMEAVSSDDTSEYSDTEAEMNPVTIASFETKAKESTIILPPRFNIPSTITSTSSSCQYMQPSTEKIPVVENNMLPTSSFKAVAQRISDFCSSTPARPNLSTNSDSIDHPLNIPPSFLYDQSRIQVINEPKLRLPGPSSEPNNLRVAVLNLTSLGPRIQSSDKFGLIPSTSSHPSDAINTFESVASTSSDPRNRKNTFGPAPSTSSDFRDHRAVLDPIPSTSTDPRVSNNTFKPVVNRDPNSNTFRLNTFPSSETPQAGKLNMNSLKRPLLKPATLTHVPNKPIRIKSMEAEWTRKQNTENNGLGYIGNNDMDLLSGTSHPVDYSLGLPKEEDDSDEGSPVKKRKVIDEKLVSRLMEMFPQACPNYIRSVCENKSWSQFDEVVTTILSTENYPQRRQRAPSPPVEVDLEEQLEIVKALLPDADPTYLRCMCEKIGNDTGMLNEFICTARETKDYPTMKEYLRKQKLSAQSKQYTTEFSVENFVQLFPEPEKTFTDPKRNIQIDHYTSLYIINFFQNRYDKLPLKVIKIILSARNMKIIDSDKLMAEAKLVHVMRSKRKRCHLDAPQNIMVLQELAYLAHKTEIETFLVERKQKEAAERQHAKENGLMNTCQCCFDEEVMPKHTFLCPKGCMFCQNCIQKSCEVAMGEGKTVYKCLSDCPEEFTLQTLQNVLPPKMFSKLAQKKTLAEIKAAGIAELEMCPFCDFASIPVENDKIFRCLNPDCMKESCRNCKEENHIPYKCDELEKDEELKARLYLENKMSEALIRKCWKCGVSFFKEEGCNKMTCSCGAKMCYLCKQPVTNYSHFNGIGGDKFELCPLYSDTNEVNRQNVVGAVEAAKADIDPSKLKVDPSANIQQHFNDRKKHLPREGHLELLQNVHQLAHREQQPRQVNFQVQNALMLERPRNLPPRDPRITFEIMRQLPMPNGRPRPPHNRAQGRNIDQALHRRLYRNMYRSRRMARRVIEAVERTNDFIRPPWEEPEVNQ